MTTDSSLAIPAFPPSEVEWEDLLVRLELMPRALRVVLEDAGLPPSGAGGVLAALAEREALVSDFLERASGLDAIGRGTAQPVAVREVELDRFVRFRARNFAIVQRRGVDVWEWAAPYEGGRNATVYQVLTGLAVADVDALARIRNLGRSGNTE